jgi:hypothetical protein
MLYLEGKNKKCRVFSLDNYIKSEGEIYLGNTEWILRNVFAQFADLSIIRRLILKKEEECM